MPNSLPRPLLRTLLALSLLSVASAAWAGDASPVTSTMSAAATIWDGQQFTTIITVNTKNAEGAPLTAGGAAVALITSLGTLSAVEDHGDGSYSATLTATELGTATVSGTIDDQPMSASVSVVMHVSTTTAVVEPATSFIGEDVTFVAAVSSTMQATISGEIVFRDGDVVIGTIQIDNGVAHLTVAGLALGTHTITAAYGGSPSFDASTSRPFTHTVQPVGLTAPTSLLATATSASSIAVAWSGGTGATAYEVHRSTHGGSLVLAATVTGSSYHDTGLAGGAVYVYAVRAINAEGASAFSTPDVANTITFTDPSLTGAVIKTAHILELRNALTAFALAAGYVAVTFQEHDLSSGMTLRAVHVAELRTVLDSARWALGIPALAYTDASPTPGAVVKATHLLDVRRGLE